VELVNALMKVLGSMTPDEFDDNLEKFIETAQDIELHADRCPVCQGEYSCGTD
jgi:hypothetical protein